MNALHHKLSAHNAQTASTTEQPFQANRDAIDAANRELIAAHYATLDDAALRYSAQIAEVEADRHDILARRSFNSPSVTAHHERERDLNRLRLSVLGGLL